jgi:FkbM family methyltransferase
MKFKYRSEQFEIATYSKMDHISHIIDSTGTFYEIDLLEYMEHMIDGLRTDTLILDVGANIGNHSLFFGRFLAETIISVEPNPLVLPTLKSNLRLNSSKWLVIEKAVGESSGSCSMHQHSAENENVGMAKVDIHTDASGQIEVTTIDAIVDDYIKQHVRTKLVAIKIDIEGMELNALKGASKTLESFKPEIFVEAQDSEALAELKALLGSYGYVAISKWAATPVFHFSWKPSFQRRVRANLYKLRHAFRSRYARSM